MKLISNLKATGMLVMYTDGELARYRSSFSAENVYFEYAPIEDTIPGAFIPLSNNVAGEFGKALVSMAKVEIGGFIPSNLLYCGLEGNEPSLIWYTEPGLKKSLYAFDGFPKELTFYVPWLVWHYHRSHLYLFAVKEKPDTNTKIYKAPFGNISGIGSVCLGGGTSLLNKKYSSFEELIKMVEMAFFGTKFTEQNDKKTIKGNLLTLQKTLAENKKPFPLNVLISYKKTVKNIIDGKESENEDFETADN